MATKIRATRWLPLTAVAAISALVTVQPASADIFDDGQLIPDCPDQAGGPCPADSCALQGYLCARGESIDVHTDASLVPEIFNPAATLTFTMVAEGAGFENEFGWYNVGDDVSDPANRHVIFHGRPGNNDEPITVVMETFCGNPNWDGGPIGFFLVTPEDTGSDFADNNNPGYVYYSEPRLNDVCPMGKIHHLVYQSDVTPNAFYFGFEDLLCGGDLDFEDTLVLVEGLLVGGATEMCNGMDDDCDSLTDEGVTRPCSTACGTGVEACIGDDLWGSCSAPDPTGETCNANDDDCDGDVDEDLTQVCSTACGDGVEVCLNGSYVSCSAPSEGTEVCDNVDNDCDGSTDENITRACNNGCPADGVETCMNGVFVGCDAPAPSPEVCDGMDNDCNGTPDDGITRACQNACGTGTETCVGGAFVGCDAPTPGVETCNGVDDNCNGVADEGITQACSTACGTGTETCVSGAFVGCTAPQPQTEVCDGADNNCNGMTDENLTRTCATACGTGTETCVAGSYVGCDAPVPENEVCDGADNDCDGDTDEDITRPCANQCGTGTETCVDGAFVGCDAPTSQPETCDNVDNDCNGAVDDGLSQPCTTACGTGIEFCQGGSFVGCTARQPQPETCDNVDNNCDGQVDEDLTRTCSSACGAGTETCVAGVWVGCTAPLPEVEVCDGVDNNCDGEADENLTRGCENACGTGTETCVDGEFSGCTAPEPSEEVCDGVDNNCNGLTDEGLTQACSTACGDGVEFCQGGTYVGCTAPVEADEVCDNVDNDCDGSIDEMVTQSCANACGPGTETCVAGSFVGCDAPEPELEVCDNIDNDCDGTTDETLTRACSGICGLGVETCVAGEFVDCSVGEPGDEVCDGEDNDCDGATDETLTQGCDTACGSGIETCLIGQWVGCSAPPVEDELCDAVDNDCDGTVDEMVTRECATACGTALQGCVDGVFEACPVPDPSEELCDGQDNDCDGTVDNNAICPDDGEVCRSGECVRACQEGECPVGKVCEGGYCVTEPCALCRPYELCQGGSCFDPCLEIECGFGELCIAGQCREGDCYQLGCEEGKICMDGACIPDDCFGVSCAADQLCRFGVCEQTCLDVVCDAENGERCLAGTCVVDSCVGTTCGDGDLCQEGSCVTDACATTSCDSGFACLEGDCVEDPCLATTCPRGTICQVTGEGNPDCVVEDEGGNNGGDPDAGIPDAGDPDAGTGDAGVGPGAGGGGGGGEDGCGCRAVSSSRTPPALWLLLVVFFLVAFRRRLGWGWLVMGFRQLEGDWERRRLAGNGVPSRLDRTAKPSRRCRNGLLRQPPLADQRPKVTTRFIHIKADRPTASHSVHVLILAALLLVACSDDAAAPPTGGNNDDAGGGDAAIMEEVCDGVDNDLDGVVDNVPGNDSDPDNCGACGNVCGAENAQATCVAGNCRIASCHPGFVDTDRRYDTGCEEVCEVTFDGDEQCDNVDNDCDGAVDEGYNVNTDPDNCGICGRTCELDNTAELSCITGRCVIGRCADGYLNLNGDPADGCEFNCEPTGVEVCDGIDNDCNGLVDDNLEPDPISCFDDGICRGLRRVCRGEEGWICPYPAQFNQGSELLCDGLDDDCDGSIDEDFAGLGTRCDGDDTDMCDDGLVVCSDDQTTTTCREDRDNVEACDGADNDCDGATDEDFDFTTDDDHCGRCGNPCNLNNGNGACVDSVCNVSGCLDDYYDRNVNPIDGCEYFCEITNSGVEICDGLDNDCNGIVDDGDLGAPDVTCLTDGVCAAVTPICGAALGWICPYPDTYDDGEEVRCDGVDNDCDGSVDEPFGNVGQACDGDDGDECADGVTLCAPDGLGTICSDDDLTVEEVCDDVDNDCDGAADEGFDTTNDIANCGRCGQACNLPMATALCVDSACEIDDCEDGFEDINGNPLDGCEYGCTETNGGAESCDGVDNDCNGLVDDNPTVDVVTCLDEGVCAGIVATCQGASGFVCVYPANYEIDEVTCDGADNDCDGSVDEGFSGLGMPCDGDDDDMCPDGVTICDPGGATTICSDDANSLTEICDTLDNDCDGVSDEGIDTSDDPNNCGECGRVCSFTDGIGECTSSMCELTDCDDGFFDANGIDADGCEYACSMTNNGVEICDGLDNDCNGDIDDNPMPDGTTCLGDGVCAGVTPTCMGASGFVCPYPSTFEPGDEMSCDGFDNDCDTNTDEGFNLGQACDGGDDDMCTDGVFVCTPAGDGSMCNDDATSRPEVCDTIDNDCDSMTDEGFDLMGDENNCGQCGQTCNFAHVDVSSCSMGMCNIDDCEDDWWDVNGITFDGCEYNCVETNGGTEICDGLDNDCNGTVDDGVTPSDPSMCTGPGVCAGLLPQCQGASGYVCVFPTTYEAAEVTCDNLDNDCDNMVDEASDNPALADKSMPCEDGMGECLDRGVFICSGDGMSVVCTASAGTPDPNETCDGLDNDCDGDTDEDIPRSSEMIQVPGPNGDVWVDIWEASRPDASATEPGFDVSYACSKPNVLPWTDVTWFEAETACQARGKRLCTDGEWSAACSADGANVYPYGDTFDGGACNTMSADLVATGSFPMCESDDGLFDMSGNIAEWTDCENPIDCQIVKGVFGGSYDDPIELLLQCGFRNNAAPQFRDRRVGFRCCDD